MTDTQPCPECGAEMYSTEAICWKCQARIAPAAEPAPHTAATPRVARQEADEATHLARWAIGFAAASIVCACPFVAPVALWLGVRSRRAGGGKLALAAAVLGGVGTAIAAVAVMILVATAWQAVSASLRGE